MCLSVCSSFNLIFSLNCSSSSAVVCPGQRFSSHTFCSLITCFMLRQTYWIKENLCYLWTHHWSFTHSYCLCCVAAGVIQPSTIGPSFLFHRAAEGRWCLSSRLPVVVPRSKVTRTPRAISLFSSQNLKKRHGRTSPASPDLESHHWREPLLLGPNAGDQIRAPRRGWPWALLCTLHPRQSPSSSSSHHHQIKCGLCSNYTPNFQFYQPL